MSLSATAIFLRSALLDISACKNTMKRHRRRLPVPQHEFGFAPQAFNLFQEMTLDGDRIARERAEMDRARHAAEAAQRRLFSVKLPDSD